jgi:hypothetical protein
LPGQLSEEDELVSGGGSSNQGRGGATASTSSGGTKVSPLPLAGDLDALALEQGPDTLAKHGVVVSDHDSQGFPPPPASGRLRVQGLNLRANAPAGNRVKTSTRRRELPEDPLPRQPDPR